VYLAYKSVVTGKTLQLEMISQLQPIYMLDTLEIVLQIMEIQLRQLGLTYQEMVEIFQQQVLAQEMVFGTELVRHGQA
jgi:hypothetical protein